MIGRAVPGSDAELDTGLGLGLRQRLRVGRDDQLRRAAHEGERGERERETTNGGTSQAPPG